MTGPDAIHDREAQTRAEDALALLRCPRCSSALQQDDGGLACVGCAKHYVVTEGVIDLRLAAAGEGTGSSAALPTIVSATPAGWKEAVRTFLGDRDDALSLLDALVAGRHQAWRGFLDLKAESRVLCIGGGYGSLVECLASHCMQVYVLEPDMARLHFILKRLAIFGVDDAAIPLAGDGKERLPFADASLDAVVMTEPTAFDATPHCLDEVRRVLRDEGQLLLIADNRLSLALPAGWWDRWATAPRPLPDVARAGGLLTSWWHRRSGPRSLPALRRRLASRRFGVVEVLGLWPSRRQFDEILPLYDGVPLVLSGEARSWRQRVKRRGLFLAAHTVVAQAGRGRHLSAYDRIYAAVARDLPGGGDGAVVRPLRYLMTRKDKMIVRARRGEEHLVIRIPLSEAAAQAEANHAAALARLVASHPGLAPAPLVAGCVDGFDYRVETALPGVPLRRLIADHGRVEVLEHVDSLLEAMNPVDTLVREPLEGAAYTRLVEARLERLFKLVRNPVQQGQLRDFFDRQLHGARLPLGLVHGDFSASNIYVAGDSAGIVDWEAAAFDDLPILDSIGYLESILRPFSPRRSLAEGFHALARWDLPSAAEERFLLARYERLDIDPAHHVGLVYLRWLRQIDYLTPYWLSYDPGGQERYIHQVIRLLLKGDAVSRK